MAITLVSSTAAATGINGGGSIILNSTGAHLLVVSVGFFSTITLSDSAGNTWTPLTLRTGSGGVQHRLYYVRNPVTAVGHIFSISGTGIYGSCSVQAFADPAGAPTFASQNGSGSSSAGTSRLVGSVTPTTTGSLVVSGVGMSNVQSSITVDAGLTAVSTYMGSAAVALAHGGGYLVQGTAAAINPTWTWNVAGDNAASIAVFTPAAPAAVETAQPFVILPV